MAEKFEYTREWTDAEAFPLLGFTKSWENPEDYPTIELDETQVRKDMQSLHDEVKNYINTKLIPAILSEDATEEARASAEAARETAEQARATAEGERASAEQARVEAENGRVSAEAARVTAEQERAAAEQARADENTGIVAQATAQAEAAAASASEAAGYKASAQKYAGDAEYYAQNMRFEVTRAAAYASDASKSATAASASETAAKDSETAAAASAEAAAASASRAEEVVGGNYATRTEFEAHTGNADVHVTAAEKAGWNERDVFIATYGTTTNAEISAACDAGKVVLCKKDGDTRIARLLLDNGVVHMFDAALYNSYTIWMCSSDNWSELTYYYTPSSHASTHARGGSDPITPASIGAAPASKYVTITLSASGWDSTAKTQTATVTGVLDDETKQLITPTPALSSQAAYYAAGILCTGQAAGSLTFTCKEVPTADLTVYVVIQEVEPA